jgi:hypothetical protein
MTIPEGASDFVSNAINALNTINTTEEGGAAIGELHTSSNLFSIQQGKNSTFEASNKVKAAAIQGKTDPELASSYEALMNAGKDMSGGSGGTITWNSLGVLVPTTGGLDKNGITDLAHELFHGLDANRGLLDNRKEQGVSRSEWQAVYRENMLRSQLGNTPLRTYYHRNQYGLGDGPRMLDKTNNPIKPYWYNP